MPSDPNKRYTNKIDYIKDYPGANLTEDLTEVSMEKGNLEEISGTSLSAADWTAIFQALENALASEAGDELRQDLVEVGGTSQTGADWTTFFQGLYNALRSQDTEVLLTSGEHAKAGYEGVKSVEGITIKDGETYHTNSVEEEALLTLTINSGGYHRVDGLVKSKNPITVDGTLKINGSIEIGEEW